MKLYSTKLGGEYNRTLRAVSSLFPCEGAVKDVTVISAYTDTHQLKEICDMAIHKANKKTRVRIRIYLDRSSSKYDSNKLSTNSEYNIKNQLDQLSKLFKNHRYVHDKSGIWLVRIGSLFHSKVVIIKTSKKVKCMIGSLNMTRNAFDKNEELVLLNESNSEGSAFAAKTASWINDKYCNSLEINSVKVPYDIEQPPCHSLRELLLSGVILNEYTTDGAFRFKINLPDKFLNVGHGGHPLMKAMLNDTISLETIITSSIKYDGLGISLPQSENISKNESWKKYCVETCYGYWCPAGLYEKAQAIIETKVKTRGKKFRDDHGMFAIIRTKRNEITDSFSTILKEINNNIPIDSRNEFSFKKTKCKWEKWYDNILTKLDNEDYCNKIITGIHQSQVPNVWSDPITSDEFEESFLDGLHFVFSQPRTKSVTKYLVDKLDLYSNQGTDDEFLKFKTYFNV